eukprot:TRINITY_DN600_c0_g2_i1.p2 TRINITY_DN600_c0_g2~~TRINITY_DN600_c0_g2_i1.p2  ORF type:complete len:185 (+),score=8.67 TRINITY_DN600_c0_g2_i1:237-791(+)
MDSSFEGKQICSTVVRPIKPPPILLERNENQKIYPIVKAWSLNHEEYLSIMAETEYFQNTSFKTIKDKLHLIQQLLNFSFKWRYQFQHSQVSTKIQILKRPLYCYQRVFFIFKEAGYKAENYEICSLLLASQKEILEGFPEVQIWAAKELGVEHQFLKFQQNQMHRVQNQRKVLTDVTEASGKN